MPDQMKKDYANILELDYDREFRVPPVTADSLVRPLGRKTVSLDGPWHFSPDIFDMCFRKRIFEERCSDTEGRDIPTDYDFENWDTIPVPSCWNKERKELAYFEGTGIYFRTFDDPRTDPGERLLLLFEGVNYEARIFLNGTECGRHLGGFTPFSIDITDSVQKEGNHLLVTANNERRLEGIPSRNYDWWNYGGIYRSVRLLAVPSLFIRSLHCELVKDGSFGKIKVSVRLSEGAGIQHVQFSIPELSVSTEIPVSKDGLAEAVLPAKPELWSPDNPKLYTIMADAGADHVEDRTGFREIRTEGRHIFLNRKEVFLKGICCHEESEETGRSLTLPQRREMLKAAKELGCNTMRLTHYPHDEASIQLADELGMMIWEEIPVYWALCFDREDTYQNAENQLLEMIRRDYNHPSIVLWGVGNENPDTDERLSFMRKLSERAKQEDPERLTTAACLVNVDDLKIQDRLTSYIDVIGMNEYYGWYYRDYALLEKVLDRSLPEISRPLVISETGAAALPGFHGDDETLFTEEHQAKVIEKQILSTAGRVNGLFPWILFDFRSGQRLHSKQGGYNRKGLAGPDHRTRKKAFAVLQHFYCGSDERGLKHTTSKQ